MKMLVGTKDSVKGTPVRAVPVGRRERLPLVEIPPAYIIDDILRRKQEINRRNEEGRRIRAPSPTDDQPSRREDEEPEDDTIVIQMK